MISTKLIYIIDFSYFNTFKNTIKCLILLLQKTRRRELSRFTSCAVPDAVRPRNRERGERTPRRAAGTARDEGRLLRPPGLNTGWALPGARTKPHRGQRPRCPSESGGGGGRRPRALPCPAPSRRPPGPRSTGSAHAAPQPPAGVSKVSLASPSPPGPRPAGAGYFPRAGKGRRRGAAARSQLLIPGPAQGSAVAKGAKRNRISG